MRMIIIKMVIHKMIKSKSKIYRIKMVMLD